MSFQSSAIDDEELIHRAACQGHRISLEIYLTQNPECINKLFTYAQSKWTPLIAACFYKYEHVVRMLLTRFKPDINTVGTINLKTLENRVELVEEVSALWTAAAVNDFDTVKLLIEHGNANINQLIKTHSTALRAACYHNNFEMVEYLIKHGANPHQARLGNYTNLMLCAGRHYPLLAKYLVNEVKCNINEQDENGQTALYYAVRSGSVEIARLLLEHGASNTRDHKRKITPLMRAALFGEVSLVDTFEGYCSDLEWIEAKELLATSFSGCITRIEDLNKTIQYLTEAFQLRQTKNLPKEKIGELLNLLPNRCECQNLDEFNQLISSNTKDALQIEIIFLHQRILGDDQNDYHDVLHNYGARLATNHEYHDCFRWWFYEFDLKQKYNIAIQNKYLQNFVNLFIQMKFKDQINVEIEDLLQMFNLVNNVLQSKAYRKDFDANLLVLLHLISFVARIIHSEKAEEQQKLSIDQYRQLYKSILSILRYQHRTIKNGSTLLHLCSSFSTETISSFIR